MGLGLAGAQGQLDLGHPVAGEAVDGVGRGDAVLPEVEQQRVHPLEEHRVVRLHAVVHLEHVLPAVGAAQIVVDVVVALELLDLLLDELQAEELDREAHRLGLRQLRLLQLAQLLLRRHLGRHDDAEQQCSPLPWQGRLSWGGGGEVGS